jgi:hypothetical protein
MGRIRPARPVRPAPSPRPPGWRPRGRARIPRSRATVAHRLLADPSVLHRWLLAAALAVVAAAVVGSVVDRAQATRDRWGPTRTVLVLDRAVRAGDPLAGATEAARWPASLVPRGALDHLPAGARAAGPATAGTPLTRAGLAPRLGGLGAGRRRIALPAGSARLPLRPGDRVDLWATTDPSLTEDGTLSTHRVAIGAAVIASSERTVVVAVEPREVADVAAAAALATVTVVATG